MPRILVVDDDPILRTAIRRMLEFMEFEIEEASNGHEAVRAFRERPADLVLCDIFMPERDGLQVMRDLKGALVVAMSGGGFHAKIDMLPMARALGAATVLWKPFTQVELLETIEKVFPAIPG